MAKLVSKTYGDALFEVALEQNRLEEYQEEAVAVSADPVYWMNFIQDGTFWQFLAYCAGVGGSMLIIGSAAGVVVMGLEQISFGWYLKKITGMAFLGYLAGALVYILQCTLI